MGIHDRDWYRDALRERERVADLEAQRNRAAVRRMVERATRQSPGRSRGPEPFWVVVAIWLVIFLVLFGIFRAAIGH